MTGTGSRNIYARGWHYDRMEIDHAGTASFTVHRTKGRRRESVTVYSLLGGTESCDAWDRMYLAVTGWIDGREYARIGAWFDAMAFTANRSAAVAYVDRT